jgi:hypothetical protein
MRGEFSDNSNHRDLIKVCINAAQPLIVGTSRRCGRLGGRVDRARRPRFGNRPFTIPHECGGPTPAK